MRGLLKNLFGRKERLPFDMLNDELVPVDIDQLEKELNIRELARRNGEMNIPSSSDKAIDGPQMRISARFHGVINEYLNKAQSKLQSIAEEIAAIDISLFASRLDGKIKSFVESLSQTIEESRLDLLEMKDLYRQRKADLKRFRLDNNIHREANYPESKVYIFGVLLLLTVLESLGNAYFFAKGAEQGYLGGTFFAFLLAVIDILIVFNIGKRIPWIFARETKHKTIGWLFLVVSACWVFIFNLIVAHIREALLISLSEWDTIALANLRQNPFSMSEMSTWILFIVGVFCSMGAIITASKSDDRFPGYGEMHRQVRQVRDDILEMAGSMRRIGIESKEELLLSIESISKDAEEKIYAISTYIDEKKKLVRNIDRFIRHNEESCNTLIQIYRDENRISRKTKSPRYFMTNWKYEETEGIEYNSDTDQKKLDKQNSILKTLSGTINEESETAQAATDNFLSQIDGFIVDVDEEVIYEN